MGYAREDRLRYSGLWCSYEARFEMGKRLGKGEGVKVGLCVRKPAFGGCGWGMGCAVIIGLC